MAYDNNQALTDANKILEKTYKAICERYLMVKLLFGILSIIPAVIAYYLYFKNMLSGRTKPHAFSWLVWGILAGNGFFARVSAHAGIGAWATGLTSMR